MSYISHLGMEVFVGMGRVAVWGSRSVSLPYGLSSTSLKLHAEGFKNKERGHNFLETSKYLEMMDTLSKHTAISIKY